MTDETQNIQIRRVTDVHADFDNEGAEEYLMTPTVDDGRLLMQMITASDSLMLDTGRGRLVLRGLN